jgi:hypothetical protein
MQHRADMHLMYVDESGDVLLLEVIPRPHLLAARN